MKIELPKLRGSRKNKVKNPARYRLDLIRENTFNRVWSVRLTRVRLWLVAAAAIFGIGAALWVIFAYTPLRTLVPGTLKGDVRAAYIETALRLDSLEQVANANEAYLSALIALMKGEVDTIAPVSEPTAPLPDSLLLSGPAERAFVARYNEENRFNLSVLAPLAAEGMVFAAPFPATAETSETPEGSITATSTTTLPISAVYRGTISAISYTPDGRMMLTLQHPNDFISIVSGLTDVFVPKGSKVSAGQRIGHAKANTPVTFELWHNGALLNSANYVSL